MFDSMELVAFVSTADPARAREFYAVTLGLRLVEEGPFALVFDVHGAMLRVALVPVVLAAPYTVLGWAVPDVAAAVQHLTRQGVEFDTYEGMGQDQHAIWTSPGGARVAWFRDPDGNILSLTQF